MKRSRSTSAVLCLLGALTIPLLGKDARATAALLRSAQALGTTQPVTGVTFQGIATYTAGSEEETVPITFTADGFDDVQMVSARAAGPMTETRHKDVSTWTGPDGAKHDIPLHNTWTMAVWFSPQLLIAEWLGDPELIVRDLGREQRSGIAVEHLQCYRALAGQSDALTKLIADASAMDLYLDSTSWLPLALEMNAHPDRDAAANIPVRVEFI